MPQHLIAALLACALALYTLGLVALVLTCGGRPVRTVLIRRGDKAKRDGQTFVVQFVDGNTVYGRCHEAKGFPGVPFSMPADEWLGDVARPHLADIEGLYRETGGES